MYSQGRLHASHATFESSISPRVLSAPAYFQQPPKTQIRAPTIPPLTPRGMEYGINALASYKLAYSSGRYGSCIRLSLCTYLRRTACSRPCDVPPGILLRVSSPATHSHCSGPLPASTQLLAPITHLLTLSAGASLGSRHQRRTSAKLACSPEGHRSWARPAYTRMPPHDTDSLFLSSNMRQHAPF